MSNIYIEQEDDGYVALQNKRKIAEGKTQEQAAKRARQKRPDDPILAERVKTTGKGKPDKWRRMYP